MKYSTAKFSFHHHRFISVEKQAKRKKTIFLKRISKPFPGSLAHRQITYGKRIVVSWRGIVIFVTWGKNHCAFGSQLIAEFEALVRRVILLKKADIKYYKTDAFIIENACLCLEVQPQRQVFMALRDWLLCNNLLFDNQPQSDAPTTPFVYACILIRRHVQIYM